jgi:acetyltransferase-like isoleucine patch superfamily enzyme
MSFEGRRFPFAACGDDVTIYELVRILDPERISVGSHVIVDDFVFVDGGGGVEIGSHVHIASFVCVIGGGRTTIADFAGLATGTRLITGTDDFDGSGLTGPTIPDRWRSVTRGEIHVGRHAVVGANSVVLPNVTVGEGAIVGAGSVVTKDVEPWTIAVGSPARPVKERPRETIERYERELTDEERSASS